MMPLTWGCSSGPAVCAGRGTGLSPDGSSVVHPERLRPWDRDNRDMGQCPHVPRQMGGRAALPRADVAPLAAAGPAGRWEATGRFGVTTGAKSGWPRRGTCD